MKRVNNRLYEFITEDQESTAKKFAASIGVPEPEITKIIFGETNGIDKKILLAISNKYPDLNIDWLTKGIGDKILVKDKKKRDHWKRRTPDEEINMIAPIIDRLTKLREFNKYTMEEIGEVVGLSVSGYSAIEQKMSKPTLPKLMKLKDLYKVSWEYLLEGKVEDLEKVKDLQEANKTIKQQAETIELLRENLAMLKEIKKTKK